MGALCSARCGALRDTKSACLVSFVRVWRRKGPITKALSKDATSIVMTAPKCYCARPAAVRVVKEDTHNKGRAFFVCPRESKDKAHCDFFKWLDAAEPTAARPPAKGHVSGGRCIAPVVVDRIPAGALRSTSMLLPCRQTEQARLDRIEQQLTAVRQRKAADDSDHGNTSDRNEHRRLLTEKFLVENDITHSTFSSGIVLLTTARGELAKLSLKSGKICLTGNNWLYCGHDKLLRLCKGM